MNISSAILHCIVPCLWFSFFSNRATFYTDELSYSASENDSSDEDDEEVAKKADNVVAYLNNAYNVCFNMLVFGKNVIVYRVKYDEMKATKLVVFKEDFLPGQLHAYTCLAGFKTPQSRYWLTGTAFEGDNGEIFEVLLLLLGKCNKLSLLLRENSTQKIKLVRVDSMKRVGLSSL